MNPYDWHLAPNSSGPCTCCGSPIAGQRSHRRMRSDRAWISRGKRSAAQQAVVAPAPTHNP